MPHPSHHRTSPRSALLAALAIVAAAVLVRAFPFVWWPHTHFDSDQAIVGLMGKHISEGRAWPLYYYGQHYMLAVEAYLAAPLMWVLGPTVFALKLPLALINVATATLLLWLLVKEARLSPWAAMVPVLPVAWPAAGVAARTTEAMGGNVEPWLYVLLLWWVRHRPFAFGATLGIGMLHREFTAYGAAALLGMDVLASIGEADRRGYLAARARHWTIVAVMVIATRTVIASLTPFGSTFGPGTTIDDRAQLVATVGSVADRLCFEPDTWPARASLLAADHLPRLVGGTGAPLREYGVLTSVYSGHPGLGPWVAAIALAGLAGGAMHWWRRSANPPEPTAHLGGYLLVVGLVSTLVFGFGVCSRIGVETLRYNLLGVFIPVGALVMAVQAWTGVVVRAGFAAAVGLWCLLNLLDVAALTREYRREPPEDRRLALATALAERGVTSAWANYRTAYHVTFLSGERVRVAAVDYGRIRAYAEEASRTGAPTLAEQPCAGGQPLPGAFLCPPPAAAATR